jgi:hypothetical protein
MTRPQITSDDWELSIAEIRKANEAKRAALAAKSREWRQANKERARAYDLARKEGR